jgi:hypothetical protein
MVDDARRIVALGEGKVRARAAGVRPRKVRKLQPCRMRRL